MGAVSEEPVVTIGVDGERWDECENAEENSASKTELGWSQEVKRPVCVTESGKDLNEFVQSKSDRITVTDEKRSCLSPMLTGTRHETKSCRNEPENY